jgi:hypothetical protein
MFESIYNIMYIQNIILLVVLWVWNLASNCDGTKQIKYLYEHSITEIFWT